jgi:hypothetical protein
MGSFVRWALFACFWPNAALAESHLSSLDVAGAATALIAKGGFISPGVVLIVVVLPLLYQLKFSKWWTGFVLLVAIVAVISGIFLMPKWSVVTGVVRNVPLGRDVQIQSDLYAWGAPLGAYIRRSINSRTNDFEFALISQERASCIDIALSVLGTRSNDASFNVQLSSDDYGNDKRLVLTVKGGGAALGVLREEGEHGREEPSSSDDVEAKDCGAKIDANVAENVNGVPDNVEELLLSDDVFTRRAARTSLAMAGVKALPKISELLSRQEYRLKLGATAALAGIQDPIPSEVKSELRKRLKELMSEREGDDAVLRQAATRALQKVG